MYTEDYCMHTTWYTTIPGIQAWADVRTTITITMYVNSSMYECAARGVLHGGVRVTLLLCSCADCHV